MFSAGKRSGKKTAQMDQKSATKKNSRSTKKEKPLVLKNSPKKMQSVLGFPCKKPVRLSPTLFPKSCSPAKPPPSLDILTSERKCTPPSSAAKSKGKRFAKSLKDVMEEAKKLQANTHSEKSSLHEEEEDQDQDRGSVQMEAKTPKAADFKIPEKYSGLAEFFDAMEAAIRLLRLRKTISTFGNICPQVETMTHRRFMHGNVAQMKYILPEALLLEKIMVHDEKTLCMKADLKISLLHDALNSAKGRQVFAFASKVNTSILRKTFHTRLVEFVQSHPEGDDVPEAMLPEPFNKKCQLTPVKLNIVISPPSCTASNPPPMHEEDVSVHERQLMLDDCRLVVSASKRRRQMLACLPKLFNMIRDIFRSSKRSVLTQEELIHKIISNHCDVTDRSEVEEQLLLLQELVPDWISGRTATSGDFLYSIKNNIDLQSIRTKLGSAL